MKRILLIGYIIRIISVNGQIDPGPYYVPGGYNLTSGTDTKIHNSIVAGVGGYNASANGQAIVEGLNYAAAMPGYAASGFINNGYATLRINGNLPRIASFHANGFAAIPKYDRFEIGIHLPSSIQSQIDSYISTGINAQGRINPYDPDQIKIECVFSLQGATPAVQHKRHGFYESQVVTGVDYAANDVWITSGTPHEYPFRIRFAPTATGVWTGTVKIYQNNTLTYSLNDFDFTVVASTNPGHLGIKNTGANGIQKFQFVDNNVVFYGLGRNIACAGYDNGSRAYSPTVDANLNENPCLERPYYESKAKPTAHREQRYYIRNLAHNGANFVRIRFDRTSVPIEETPICNQIPSSGTLVGYPYNPSSTDLTNFSRNERQMWEMDSTLRTCEINKMYILLTLLDDHDFSLQAQYETDQNGNVLVDSSGNPIRIQVVGWNGNPYKPMVSSRDDFFTDPNCIAIFKKRLYYIEARWGYSTQIAAWEMFNETENMDKNGWNQTLRLKIGAWLCEMKSYLQSADISPHHPFSNASVYQPWSGPVSVNVQPSQNNCLDFNIEHMYSGEAMNCSTGGRYHPSTPALQDLNTAYTKPHMVSEFGVLPYASVVRDGPMTFHTQNWGSIFANDLTVALQWAWWYSGTPATVNPYHIQYQALRAFIDRVNFNTQLIMGRNVPCGNTNCSGCSLPVETYWLKTALSDTIYGWSKNITANFMTDGSIPTPFPSQSDLASELANSDYYGVVNPPSATVSATSNVIIIPGLQANTLYNLKIYDTWNPSGSLLLYSPITSNGSGVISFGLDMSYLPPSANSNPPYPDYAFIITKNIQSGQEPQNPPGNGKLARQNSSSINFSDNNNASAIVNIYPIPSSEKLFVQFDKSAWENPKFSLVDQLGKEIEMVLDLDNGLVVRNIPTGFYILKIKDRNKEISSKVIIQH